MTRHIQLFVSAGIFIFYFSCSDKSKEIVAEFGDQQITLQEFRIAYLDVIKKPNVFDSPENREKFLDELIASRLLAHEAEGRGYYDEKMQYRAQAYKNKALREAHFESVIKPMFSVSEEDIQQAYLYMQEQRRISHIFAKTRSGIDSVYALLKHGYSFNELAEKLFDDSLLAHNGGDLGWVHWDELEYDLAMTAFQLPPDSFSTPVKSQFGFHIVKVTDYKKNPLITRAQYEAHKQKAKAKLEFMLGDKYAFAYVNNLMNNVDIQISPAVATSVRSKLKHVFTRQPDQFNQAGEMQLNENEVKQVEINLWDMRHEVLATINGKDYTVGEFIGALQYVPYNIPYNNFKDAMYYAFRDFLIEQEALTMGLENSDTVFDKFTLYKEYLLQLGLRRDLVRLAKVTDEEKQAYFQDNREKFKGVEFSQVEKIITDIIERNKRAQAVPEFLLQLADNRSVKKYPEIIHNYYDSVLNKN